MYGVVFHPTKELPSRRCDRLLKILFQLFNSDEFYHSLLDGVSCTISFWGAMSWTLEVGVVKAKNYLRWVFKNVCSVGLSNEFTISKMMFVDFSHLQCWNLTFLTSHIFTFIAIRGNGGCAKKTPHVVSCHKKELNMIETTNRVFLLMPSRLTFKSLRSSRIISQRRVHWYHESFP